MVVPQDEAVTSTDHEQDRRCLERVQAGDQRALAELYGRHTPLLYSVALRILKSPADAEDVLQEAWLQVWKRAGSFDPKRGSAVAWLLTVARTRAIDRYRSKASRGRAESSVDPEPLTPPVDPSATAGRSQLRDRVRQAFEQLSPEQRRVLEIAYFQGLSQTEIAELVKAPLGTVKSWTRQGLTRLRELLPQEEWV